ncbi:SDR family oxidoreductase [Lichenibacterium dinghuense]|uniref:SDR family oxidoreductase n=1 Tax=Lichenibacterium dinghuense TaxID=2895977 RepID=UPI001F491073|nr:NAD(P)H-binding protein [Lichenibacterium sp. 6Y81]
MDGETRTTAKSPPRGPVVVLGASNLIAGCLLPRLAAAGVETVAVARRDVALPPGVGFARVDFEAETDWRVPPGAAVVSVLPLALLAASLDRLAGARAIVAIGSTSLHSKAESDDPRDRATAEKLARAEAALAEWCGRRGVAWTVLRPTLVYDGYGDRNVARMIRLVRRARVLPIARPSSGLRQPIHVDDIAEAILGALDEPRARDRAFDIAGGEVITYRAMAERVFASQGLTPRFVVLPVPWLRFAFACAARAGIVRETGFGSAVFARMNQDLVFDVAEGLEVLGYAPRPFQPPRWAPVTPRRRRP